MFTTGKHFIEYKHVLLRLEKHTNEFLLKKSPFSVYIVCTVQDAFLLTWNARFRTSKSNEEERRRHRMESQSPFVRDISHVTAHQLVRFRACAQGNVVFALLTTQFFSKLSTLTEITWCLSLKHN